MAFHYERISEQDQLAFGLLEIEPALVPGSRWVINRDTGVYLRYLRYEREQPGHKNFCFYWQQQRYLIKLESLGRALPDQRWCTHWRWLSLSLWQAPASSVLLDDELRTHLLTELKAALTAYRDGSLNPSYCEHIAEFEF